MKTKKVKVKPKKKSFFDKIKKLNWKKVVTWSPRILVILYIIFITLFAFDESVFSLPWFVHLMPTLILTLILVLTWRKPLSAGIIFLILGVGFTFVFKTYETWLAFLIISLPLILVGILFLLERIFLKKKKKNHQEVIKARKEKLMKRK
jgi:hypothetical protein